MSFPCIQCGLCCQNLNESSLYDDLNRGDGTCKYYLEEEKKCSIYDQRPLKCRIDDMYDAYFSKVMNKKEYYEVNIKACQSLIDKNKSKEGL